VIITIELMVTWSVTNVTTASFDDGTVFTAICLFVNEWKDNVENRGMRVNMN